MHVFYYILLFIIEPEEQKTLMKIIFKIKSINSNDKKRTTNKLKICFIIITIAIGYNNYISSKMLLKGKTIFEIRIYHVIFNTIFCKIILGYEIYRHQLFSLILILIGWIFISIPIFLKFTTKDIYYNILFLFGALFYPLYLVLLKYIIENYYISVYLDMFFIGIILLVISTILTIINSSMVYSNLSDLINIFDFAYDKLLIFLAFASGTIVKYIFCVIIVNFSPNIFVLTNVISFIITWIYNVKYKKNPDTTSNIIFLSIGYFIILVSCLIYNEIIILNFFGLNKNTIYNINERIDYDRHLSENNDERELKDIGDYYIEEGDKNNKDNTRESI